MQRRWKNRWSRKPETVILPGYYRLSDRFDGFFVFSHRLANRGSD
jgi:hypothetical protein